MNTPKFAIYQEDVHYYQLEIKYGGIKIQIPVSRHDLKELYDCVKGILPHYYTDD